MADQAVVVIDGKKVAEAVAGNLPAAVQQGGAVVEQDRYWLRSFTEWPLDARFRLCEYLAQSDSVPVAMRGKPANVYYVAERGARLGLSPTESVSHIMVVNGTTSVWGDYGMAKVRQSGLLADHAEWFEVDGQKIKGDRIDVVKEARAGKDVVAWVRVHRKGDAEAIERSFSVEDAMRADLWHDANGIWKKDGWRKSPKRMLMHRARWFALREKFQDVLMGFVSVEEAMDHQGESVERSEMAERSQAETKGAAIAATMEAERATLPEATVQEIEMVESMLAAVDRVDLIKSIREELGIPAIGADAGGAWMTPEKAELYIRAMSLAVDQVTAEKDAAASKGELPLGTTAKKTAAKK